jgi:hypothetical protein
MKREHKRELLVVIFAVLIQTMFIYIILRASPITDEYCFASQSREFGVLSSFNSLLNLWSPSLGYLPTLAIFSLPISGTTISSILISFSFIILNIFFLLLAYYLFKPNNKYQALIAYSKTLLIFIIPLSMIQTSGYLNYNQVFHNPLVSFKYAFLEIFSFTRDGQLLIWISQISLTWQKNIMSVMILAIPFVLARYDTELKYRKILLVLLSVLFLSYGPNTESYIFLITLILFIGYRTLTQKADVFLFFITIMVTLGLLSLSISSGSRNRQTHFEGLSIEVVSSRFGTVLIQIAVMITTGYIVLKAISNFLEIFVSQRFKDTAQSLKIVTRVTVCAGILANLLVGSFVYISTYHWISLAFLIVFWIFMENCLSLQSKTRRKPALDFISFIIIYSIMITSFAGIGKAANDREVGWNSRVLENGQGLPRSLPIYDLKGNLIAFDLNIKSASIIPMEGFIEGAALVCFKKLVNF